MPDTKQTRIKTLRLRQLRHVMSRRLRVVDGPIPRRFRIGHGFNGGGRKARRSLDTDLALLHFWKMLPIVEILADEPTAEQRDQVLNLLLDFNGLHTGHLIDRPNLGILLRDPDTAEIIGGLYASDEYNWLFIKYLIVPEALRGKGLGAQLMREAERVARERGYLGMFLDTFDFQAKPFYLKLGFEPFGELEGDAHTPRRFFLKKLF